MKKILFLICFCFPFSVSADMDFDNYIVKDIDSGRVFDDKASNIKILPASTTKIMTAIVAIENSNLYDVVKVSDEILPIDGSNIYLEVNEYVLMENLLYGMLLRSGNDAATVISRYVGNSSSNFIKMMNDKARSLGLLNTTFNNSTGLDDYERNYSTVNDLSIIYSYAYKNDTFRNIIKEKRYSFSSTNKSYSFKNRSKILFMYDKCTGAKTGYTPKAGRLLVSSASNKDLNIVIVSHGNTYGYNEHIDKYEEIFNKYKRYEIINKDKFKIKNSSNKRYYIKNDFYYPLDKDETNKISKKIIFNNNKTGYVGDLVVFLNDKELHKERIYLKDSGGSILTKIKTIFNS